MDADQVQMWADLLKAAAHPTRLMIMDELARGVKCVTDIRDLLDVRQANVSQHLAVLRHSGLVAFYQEGGLRCYYLARPALVEALFGFLDGDYPTVRRTKDDVRREGMRRTAGAASGSA